MSGHRAVIRFATPTTGSRSQCTKDFQCRRAREARVEALRVHGAYRIDQARYSPHRQQQQHQQGFEYLRPSSAAAPKIAPFLLLPCLFAPHVHYCFAYSGSPAVVDVWIGPTTSQAEREDVTDHVVNVTKRHVEALGVPVLGHRFIAEAPAAREA